MTILWDTDPAALETYHYAVGGQARRVDAPQAVMRDLVASSSELLVVIGADIDVRAACDLAEQVRIERPEVGVVLLRRRLDVTVLGQALRSGIREVVVADDHTCVAEACARSLEVSRRLVGITGASAAPEGRVVTVFAAKGGCGKTTIATNLSAYLATAGRRVLIVDLDLAFGDVAISMQLMPKHSTTDLVAMAGHLDEQGLASVVTRHPSGLDAICAPSNPGDADRIPGAVITELLRVARRVYDFVIIDTPPAFTEHTLAAFDTSDVAILLATLDIPAVKNLRLALNTLDLLGHPQDSRVVVLNRADAKVGLHVHDVVKAIGQPIAATLPSSANVPASVNRGVAIVADEPKHAFSVAVRGLADRYVLASHQPSRPGAPGFGSSELLPTRRELRQRRKKVRR
jgi:pilus assembly protein CpaE